MNRRQALATAGAVTSLSLCAGIIAGAPSCTHAPAAEPTDAMADLATAYIAANEALNASDIDDDAFTDAFCAAHIDPLRDRLLEDAPIPTTMAGALAAARLVERSLSQKDCALVEPLIVALRQFLEGRA